VKAIHPLTYEELPIYVTSYVINDYGTGAIMGVPFHDEKDCAFALENDITLV
jgi:leucyl-tRNA synthetase